MRLTETQEKIVNQKGNLVVMASAGTGKTYTMVKKIEKEIIENKDYKVIAAITFTIKAANEIKERLKIDVRDHFIGTNNSFAINEIIKPFLKDILGDEYDIEMNTNYAIKVNTLNEGIEMLKNTKTLCSYRDAKKNFIFQLALKIVKESKACELYLKSKFFKLYIDEYQDCDRDMHDFFMYLCDELKMEMFIVGDDKQSIYMWRGAYPEAFKSIKQKENFENIFMYENFRSCQQIQNYSNLLFEETRNLYKEISDKNSIYYINTNINDWATEVLKYIDKSKNCALLRFRNIDAENGANDLSNAGFNTINIPTIPISDITTESARLYNSIAKIFIMDRYTEYDIIDEAPNADNLKINILKQLMRRTKENIENIEKFKLNIKEIGKYFGYVCEESHIEKLYKTITEKRYHAIFKIQEFNNISITFHSSKGLEYDQVIVFASDYDLKDNSSVYNHYVAVTRAKEKLLIINCNNYQFERNLTNILNTKHLVLEDIMEKIENSSN